MGVYSRYLLEATNNVVSEECLYEEYDYYDLICEASSEKRQDVTNRIEIARCLEDCISGWLSSLGITIFDFFAYEQSRIFSKKPDKKFCNGKINYVKIICSKKAWGATIGGAIGSLIGYPNAGAAIGSAVDNLIQKRSGEVKEALKIINEDSEFKTLKERTNKLIKRYGYEIDDVSVKGKNEVIFTIYISKLKEE
jgi:hypothetical protein